MVKRTLFIQRVVSGVLAMAAGTLLSAAVSQGSWWYGIMGIIAFIGSMLNILCSHYDSEE